MDWKLGLLFAAIQTAIIVLDWFGVKPNMRRTVGSGPSRSTTVSIAILMVLTWAAVGFDYYDRHQSHRTLTQSEWAEAGKHLKPASGDLTNRTVPLDGYDFENCQLGNSILIYEGTAPTIMNCTMPTGSVLTLQSDDPAVSQAMMIVDMLDKANPGKLMCKPANPNIPLLPP